MSRQRLPIVVLIVASLLVLAAMNLFHTSPTAEAARTREERLAAGREPGVATGTGGGSNGSGVVSVDAVRVEEIAARVEVDFAVTLEAVRTVVIGAEIGGRVVAMGVEENETAAEGDAIVRLDAAVAEAAVARARAAVVRARSASSLATTEHGRQQSLSGRGVASEAEFDRTKNEANATDALVAEAEAQLVEAETSLAKTRIVAPFAGVISEFDLEPGAYLRVGDPVARLSDLSQIEVEIGVDDRQILTLEVGASVMVRVDAYPGEWFEGAIYSRARTPDPITHKYPVPVRIANPDERLLPGMLGQARVVLGEAGTALRLPARTVYSEFEIDYVYVLSHDDLGNGSGNDAGEVRANQRRVKVVPVPFRPDLIDIADGLTSGELVALSGVRNLRDGLIVRAHERDARWND